MKTDKDVYGMCPHGENMASCWECERIIKGSKVPSLDFPDKPASNYVYFLEYPNERWVHKEFAEKETYDPTMAMQFNTREEAEHHLTIMPKEIYNVQLLKVTEHEFMITMP